MNITVCINEETIGAINEAAISIIRSPRNTPSCFLSSCFTVSVALLSKGTPRSISVFLPKYNYQEIHLIE